MAPPRYVRRFFSPAGVLAPSGPSLLSPSALSATQRQGQQLVIEDEEDMEMFHRIAAHYLENKFHDCVGGEICPGDVCIVLEENDVRNLLREVLPPLTNSELDKELEAIYGKFAALSASVPVEDFVKAVMNNRYWLEAGPFVVKELIYLDCLHNYYRRGKSFLANDEYNELKESLAWEGSAAASLTAKEALFIHAVASFNRGQGILSEEDYNALKNELREADSWVVKRQQDPLEKLGLNTFMSYLHRAL
eukprot:scaffold4592_cov169-Ochromonas_danica.AAC.9